MKRGHRWAGMLVLWTITIGTHWTLAQEASEPPVALEQLAALFTQLPQGVRIPTPEEAGAPDFVTANPMISNERPFLDLFANLAFGEEMDSRLLARGFMGVVVDDDEVGLFAWECVSPEATQTAWERLEISSRGYGERFRMFRRDRVIVLLWYDPKAKDSTVKYFRTKLAALLGETGKTAEEAPAAPVSDPKT